MNLVPRQRRHKYFVGFPLQLFYVQFFFNKYVQGKSDSPKSAPDRQVFKIKTDESEYRTQGTSVRQSYIQK